MSNAGAPAAIPDSPPPDYSTEPENSSSTDNGQLTPPSTTAGPSSSSNNTTTTPTTTTTITTQVSPKLTAQSTTAPNNNNGFNSSDNYNNNNNTNNNNNNNSSSSNSHSARPTRSYQAEVMDQLFRFRLPSLPSSQAIRTAGVYVAGALFSLGFFFFIDSAVYSKVNNPGDVHVKFVDWIPGICSALGMLVINSIEKSRLNADSFSYSGNNVAWKARLVLFLGFALMAGGLAGSVTVLIIKYIVPQYEFSTLYFGIANVIANGMIMLSSIVLWVSQNMEDDYSYHLSL